ncbi:hypothetical protein ACEWY4_018333 [Coilia grayii]|uniref:GATA-type domain-containing protein n=1 Tax=Coilia grayii TaxID=363190 RepID=A0ABD1JJD8_9TELE
MTSQESMKSPHDAPNDTETQDTQVSQSSILYLLQEASKLALPPKAQDHTDTVATTIPDYENPEQKQSPSKCISPSLLPGGKGGGGTRPSEQPVPISRLQGSSPLEVMHLINQQCERLLYPGQRDEEAGGFMALSTHSSSENIQCLYSSSSSHVKESKCVENPVCPTSSLSHTLNKINNVVSERRETDAVEEEVRVAGGTEPTPDNAVKSPQFTTEEAADAQQVNLSDHNYSFSCSTECSVQTSCQLDRVELLCAEVVEVVVSPATESSSALVSEWRPTLGCQVGSNLFHSPSRKGDKPGPSPSCVMEAVLDKAGEGGIEPRSGWALDCNNNIELQGPSKTMPSAEHEYTGLEISSATLKLGLPTGQAFRSEHKSPHNQAGEDCSGTQGKPQAQAPGPQPNSWRGRTPRKQAHPSRSANPHDPNLQGVIFSMNTELDDGSNQCRLLITSNYSKELPNRGCKRKRLPREASSSEEEEEAESICSLSTTKTCASCCTRKTPLWRDAEDGTPLCNACGIRYKKYRVRCTNCWHIPRKDSKSKSKCFKCGDKLRPSAHHKRGEW